MRQPCTDTTRACIRLANTAGGTQTIGQTSATADTDLLLLPLPPLSLKQAFQ